MRRPVVDTDTRYQYADASLTHAHAYLWPALKGIIAARLWPDKRAFDLGCGNGAIANLLSELGFAVTGVDPSEQGIVQARAAFPLLRIEQGTAYDDLAGKYGKYPLVVSIEVIEHLYYPRRFAKTCFDLVADGGILIISTPYHGYLKNLALSLFGKWDDHLDPLWEGGHIKAFSVMTLRALLNGAGFNDIDFLRIGRIPSLAKSMIAIARK